jgi:acyl-coenzyme A thioesterase PaaI-like protein
MAEGGGNVGDYGAPVVLKDGPFAGWMTWGHGSDPFETLSGPFCFKVEADGRVRAAFQPEEKHLNGGGALHGGLLMTFADFSLFAIAHSALKSAPGVTLTFNSEFVGAGSLDGLVECEGRVIRETRSVIFVQGLLTQTARPLLAFSGTIKKLRSP